MGRRPTAHKAGKLPLLLGVAALTFALPTAGLALGSFVDSGNSAQPSSYNLFTPANVDPQLARRVAGRLGNKEFRFTPAGQGAPTDRTVTVAVRVDSATARAITIRSAIEAAPGKRASLTGITPTSYNLGIARDYESFARPIKLPDSVRNIAMPDLAEFEPSGATAKSKPSRFQPRISLEDKGPAGRSADTFETVGTQTVDVGGAYSVTRNLDVTAGVRLSQESERLAPLSDSAQDNQAVYVGTQFRF